ncbi:protein of unknown function (DU1801) [Bernardetia litoralis DSM 6794]|uniref:YdhG-like domain-containing protein n=1 Tax=Bernardetia litoralis (strain ATCC 23117 / DSM 6794 / NBRC 15988 / NCIMB 1366 / Fx l1 / Sio-4) TaxID=880071 RepID=I4ANT9_BERLS|nr:DUF1801 domain-containing protein [Bernardetia litoralis]AFM05624.1 protein of unknown function (DU1801) [Bernardetia litoralis DSM 6794]
MKKSEAVSEYFFKQEKYQNELFYLRKLIFEQLPNVKESIKWKMPFYDYQKKPLLYLRPIKENLIIGFMDGANLEDEEHLFAQKSLSLKRIRYLYFPQIIEQENIENLTEKEIEIQNKELQLFEQNFCKMLQKATIFIDNKSANS